MSDTYSEFEDAYIAAKELASATDALADRLKGIVYQDQLPLRLAEAMGDIVSDAEALENDVNTILGAQDQT